MPVTAALVFVLARKILATQQNDSSLLQKFAGKLLGEDEMAEGIFNLLQTRDLNLGTATEANDFNNGLMDLVIKAVSKYQDGHPGLEADGFLGKLTHSALLRRPFGHHNRNINTLPVSQGEGSNPRSGSFALRYFVVPDRLGELQGITPIRAQSLILSAWASWAMVCKVDPKPADSREKANVIIQVRELPGEPKSVLALADVGPPGKQILDLSLDVTEQWDEQKFQATVCHEGGHILGLDHIGNGKCIMNDFLNNDIVMPQKQDQEAAQRVGW